MTEYFIAISEMRQVQPWWKLAVFAQRNSPEASTATIIPDQSSANHGTNFVNSPEDVAITPRLAVGAARICRVHATVPPLPVSDSVPAPLPTPDIFCSAWCPLLSR